MNKKKILMIFVLIIFVALIITALVLTNNKVEEQQSNKDEERPKDVIEITDNYFIQQTDDVYVNINDYVGKKIKLEGFVYPYLDQYGKTLYAIVRRSPGCCGDDGIVGLDVINEDGFPEKDTWVEVIGIVQTYSVNLETVPVIIVSSMQEKEPGVTFVSN
jgi:uncharacterized membrane protein YcgQ (UPF0703/DUF1980 family)